jgi:hypothetical protein
MVLRYASVLAPSPIPHFLSLSLSLLYRPQGRNIDLPERREDVASALEMTLAYSGGPSATPSQRRQAAAVLAKTPLSLLAASRFDRRDDRAADFLLQSCAVSRVRGAAVYPFCRCVAPSACLLSAARGGVV